MKGSPRQHREQSERSGSHANPRSTDNAHHALCLDVPLPVGVWAERRGFCPLLTEFSWKFGLAPYLWLPAMQGEITVRGHTVDVDLDLGDTLDLVFDSLKFAFMGALRPTKGPCSSRWTCCTSISKATRRRPGGCVRSSARSS